MESPPHILRRLLPWRSPRPRCRTARLLVELQLLQSSGIQASCPRRVGPSVEGLGVRHCEGCASKMAPYDHEYRLQVVARFISSALSVAVELCEKRRPNG